MIFLDAQEKKPQNMTTWTSSEILLNLSTVPPNTIYNQDTTTSAALCLTSNANVPNTNFSVQTNGLGMFLLNNSTNVNYKGTVWLAPNTLFLFSVRVQNGQPTLACDVSTSYQTNVVLAWITFFANNVNQPSPKMARTLADFALAVYQSLVTFPDEFPQAVANEAARIASSLLAPGLDVTAIYNQFPQLGLGIPLQFLQNYVTNLINVTLAYPAIADDPVYAGPPPTTPPPFLWTGVNPELPNWSNVPYLANTFTTMPGSPVDTMPEDAKTLQVSATSAQIAAAQYISKTNIANLLITLSASLLGQYAVVPVIDMAQIMALLTLSMADSAVYTWTVKYLFWGARPNQYIYGLVPRVPTPNSPSYVSGVTTMACVWAYALGLMFPVLKPFANYFMYLSSTSRLWGLINFETDVDRGCFVGDIIAQVIFQNLETQIKNKLVFVA
jgi:hypothetical protein